jgi:hypothetical protein
MCYEDRKPVPGQAWWCMCIIPAAQEAEVGFWSEARRDKSTIPYLKNKLEKAKGLGSLA